MLPNIIFSMPCLKHLKHKELKKEYSGTEARYTTLGQLLPWASFSPCHAEYDA
jgi:hypothetical protein